MSCPAPCRSTGKRFLQTLRAFFFVLIPSNGGLLYKSSPSEVLCSIPFPLSHHMLPFWHPISPSCVFSVFFLPSWSAGLSYPDGCQDYALHEQTIWVCNPSFFHYGCYFKHLSNIHTLLTSSFLLTPLIHLNSHISIRELIICLCSLFAAELSVP